MCVRLNEKKDSSDKLSFKSFSTITFLSNNVAEDEELKLSKVQRIDYEECLLIRFYPTDGKKESYSQTPSIFTAKSISEIAIHCWEEICGVGSFETTARTKWKKAFQFQKPYDKVKNVIFLSSISNMDLCNIFFILI